MAIPHPEKTIMTGVSYYMTPGSPWSYLGSKLFARIARDAGAEVTVYAVDFGAIFPATGGLPLPMRSPERRAYRLQELARWKRRRGAPMHLQPANFPVSGPTPALAIVAAREAGHDAHGLSAALLAALWEDDRNIDDPDIVASVCEACGLPAAAIMEASGSRETAERFEADTREAIERGVFGAPSWLIGGELFWGQDRLDFVAEKLGVA